MINYFSWFGCGEIAWTETCVNENGNQCDWFLPEQGHRQLIVHLFLHSSRDKHTGTHLRTKQIGWGYGNGCWILTRADKMSRDISPLTKHTASIEFLWHCIGFLWLPDPFRVMFQERCSKLKIVLEIMTFVLKVDPIYVKQEEYISNTQLLFCLFFPSPLPLKCWTSWKFRRRLVFRGWKPHVSSASPGARLISFASAQVLPQWGRRLRINLTATSAFPFNQTSLQRKRQSQHW